MFLGDASPKSGNILLGLGNMYAMGMHINLVGTAHLPRNSFAMRVSSSVSIASYVTSSGSRSSRNCM